MFSTKEKQFIPRELEGILLSLNHPEMAGNQIDFKLHVDGKES